MCMWIYKRANWAAKHQGVKLIGLCSPRKYCVLQHCNWKYHRRKQSLIMNHCVSTDHCWQTDNTQQPPASHRQLSRSPITSPQVKALHTRSPAHVGIQLQNRTVTLFFLEGSARSWIPQSTAIHRMQVQAKKDSQAYNYVTSHRGTTCHEYCHL